MKIIKVSGLHESILHQTLLGQGIYDDCKFIFNDPNLQECDAWFIFDPNCLKEDNKCYCSKDSVYFVMGEPDNIHIYNNRFVHQFENVIGIQYHKYNINNFYRDYWGMWFVGLAFKNGRQEINPIYDYDKLLKMKVPQKKRLVSVVSSDKKTCKGHRLRLDFVDKLKQHFGDKIDIYGRGINNFVDKADVLMPYKYHIVIENTSQDDYITEKLFDPYLTYTYPIYYGAKNANEYFIDTSFSCIDIEKPNEAIDMIENIISSNLYEERLNDIIDSRNKVLRDYNLFNKMRRMVKNNMGDNKKELIYFKPEYEFDYKFLMKKFLKIFGNKIGI